MTISITDEPRIEINGDDTDGYKYVVKIDTPEGEETWVSNFTYESESEALEEGKSAIPWFT